MLCIHGQVCRIEVCIGGGVGRVFWAQGIHLKHVLRCESIWLIYKYLSVPRTRIGEAMAPHSRTLAWKIPWTEEPGRLQSMGSLRVGHDWATSLSLFTFMHWRKKWQPTPVFLPGESQGRGSLVAAVYGVAQSRTLLQWLSSSSSSRTRMQGEVARGIWWGKYRLVIKGLMC